MASRDLNRDGFPDLVVANGNDPSNSFSVLLGSAGAAFTWVGDFGTGLEPSGATIGDFNGDGFPDVATNDPGAALVTVNYGDGTGSFGVYSYPFTDGAANEEIFLPGDFNDDGLPDIVVLWSRTTELDILPGIGNGLFGLELPQPTANFQINNVAPLGAGVADMNGDGELDIVVLTLANQVISYLGTGTAQFNVGMTTSLGPGVGVSTDVVLADFNEDGLPDIAVMSANASNQVDAVTVLLGDGTGAFMSEESFSVGLNALHLVAGDFNGDHHVDLATDNELDTSSNGTVSVLRGKGDGTFAASVDSTVGAPTPYRIAAGDFDQDGQADIAVSFPGGSYSVLLSVGGGAFGTPTNFTSPGLAATYYDYYPLQAADMNGDGLIDLIAASSTPVTSISDVQVTGSAALLVLPGNGDGTFGAATYPVPGPARIIMTGDLNLDGRPDFVTAADNVIYDVAMVQLNTCR